MTTYASFDITPSPAPYLTPGKRYEVVEQDGDVFFIIDDEGDMIPCRWKGCMYLHRGNWTRHDETDALRDAAPEMYEALKEAISLMEALGVKGGRYVRALAAIAKAEGKA